MKGWKWVTKTYGDPKSTDDEFTDWYRLAKIEEDPNLYNAFKGHQVDAYVKKELMKSGADEEYNLYITRPGEFGPDVVDLSGLPDWVVWYDIPTSAQWAAHLARYFEVFGPNGYGVFWDQIEEELEAEGGGEIVRIGP